jgi:signal transduction histidine kinase
MLVGEIRTSLVDYYGKLAQQVLVNDITENRRLQQELNLQGQLREKQITEAIFIAQEEEREHIGKELHDNINQLLATAKLCFMAGEQEHGITGELMSNGLKALDTAITEIRNLSKGLVGHEIMQAGLINSIKDLIDTINLTRKLQIELKVTGPVEENMKGEEKLAIYRIIQEQLSNVIRHSHASHVRIDLGRNAFEVVLRIDDDGKGFNVRTARKGIGITNIINRVKLLDGDVRIDTSPDKGCMLEVQMKTTPVHNI